MTTELTGLARAAASNPVRTAIDPVATGRWRRRPYTTVHSWGQLVADLVAHEPPRLLLLDVDPAVAGWRAGATAISQGMTRVELLLLETVPVARLVWATNTSRIAANDMDGPPYYSPAGSRLLVGAGKPRLGLLRRELCGMLRRRPIVVVGDQWLMDGLPAWWLGARFVRWHHTGPNPWWAKLQQLAGQLLVRPLYRPERCKQDRAS